jgi:hypothetical protein
MNVNADRSCASAFKSWITAVFAVTLAAVPFLVTAGPVEAANSPALRLIKLIPINGTAGNRNTQINSFDISWFDAATGLYYLGDRSNADIDVVDTTGSFTGTPDTLFGQIGGSALGFAGDTGTTATSGPNGVVSAAPCIFATDSPSRVVSINSNASFVRPVSSVSTGGQFRADELAYDPTDGLLLVINNADTPAFGTLISVNKTTCALTLGTKINFTSAGTGGLVNATNGAEQPVWEPMTQRFYLSIPEVNGPGGGGTTGGVARITTSGTVEAFYPINFCQPAGLTVGPNGDLLVGCNTVFDFSGKACKAVVPSPSPTGAPAICTGAVANPQSVICNPARGCTPSNGSLVAVYGVGGGDEVWFNPGDGNYYVTAGNNPIGPSLGVIKSVTNVLTQVLPTLPPTVAIAGVHGSGTVHSVAASSLNNHVYVPIPANTAYSTVADGGIGTGACTQGCIAVFSAE